MRRFLLPLLLLASSVFGRDIITGFCETGAQRVVTQGIQSSNYMQRSNPGCTVTVYLANTLTPATIFSTVGGGVLANPFVASADGFYFFWADSGAFDVKLSGSTIVVPVTRPANVGSVGAGGLLAANNLSDLNNIGTARTNLGLGGASILNVGTTAGTVAAGDDARLPTAAQKLALAGTFGAPTTGNEYVTATDVVTTATANRIPRLLGTGLLFSGVINYSGQLATAGQPGFLSAADWTTFNAKASPGNYITALIGDVGATGPGSVAGTISTNAVTLAKFQQIATASLVGRNTAGTGNIEVLSTIPNAVQDNITRLGTIASGSIPYSLLTGAPSTVNAASDGVTKGVVTFISNDFACTAGQCLINYAGGQKATAVVAGFLSNTDWATFNNKQAGGNYITQLTGDGTAVGPGSVAFALANIPTAVTMAGYLQNTPIAAPATPAAGKSRIYVDSTSKNISVKDDAGVIKHGVQTKVAVANNFITSIADDGTSVLAPGLIISTPYLYDSTNYYIAPSMYQVTPSMLPDVPVFTWKTTQGTATETVVNHSLLMTVLPVAGDNVRFRGVAKGANTTLVAAMSFTAGLQNYHDMGLILNDSGGTRYEIFGLRFYADTSLAVFVGRYTSATALSAYPYLNATFGAQATVWLRIRITGGNLFFDYSTNGKDFANIYTEAATAFFAVSPDTWGYGANSNGADLDGAYVTLLSFKQS